MTSDARRMGKSELFSHFAERFEVKRTQAREFFDELNTLAEKELKRSGEFVLPGMVKLVVKKSKRRMAGALRFQAPDRVGVQDDSIPHAEQHLATAAPPPANRLQLVVPQRVTGAVD